MKQNYCFSVHNDIYNLTKPLMDYLILHCFQYSRIYYDGRRVELATNPEHLYMAFVEKPYMRQVFTPSLTTKKDKYLYIPSWIESLPDDAKIPLTHQLNLHKELFNIGNEFSILYDREDINSEKYREVFHFFFSKDDYTAINRCLNNISVLENFCEYFVKSAEKLISSAEKDPIVKSQYQTDISFINNKKHNPKKFLSNQAVSGKENINLSILSKRELDCVYFITRGFTSKQIGKKLNLSHRTIETYIENIKNKFYLKSKFEIAEKFINVTSDYDFNNQLSS